MRKQVEFFKRFQLDLKWAVILFLVSAVLAIAYNLVRDANSLPFLAEQEYTIFVPCPEPQGDAEAITSQEALSQSNESCLFIDARDETAYHEWHINGAINIKYDFLFPVSSDALNKILDQSPSVIYVYGDIDRVNTGELLAKELSASGLKNIYYIVDEVNQEEERQ